MDRTPIFKVLRHVEWLQFEKFNVFSGSPVDLKDGFIHLSTGVQLRETVAKHFAAESGLMLLAVDSLAAGPALRWEPSRGGALFPHLYAPLTSDMILWTAPLPLGPDGAHAFPEGAAEGGA